MAEAATESVRTGHIGLIPSCITWTGWRAVGKTAIEAIALWHHAQKLESIGVFGAELGVVPDRVARYLSEHSSQVMLGMGAGKYADAKYLFTEDVCGYGKNHKPRHDRSHCEISTNVDTSGSWVDKYTPQIGLVTRRWKLARPNNCSSPN